MNAPRIVTERDQLGANVWRAWDDRLGLDASPVGYGHTEAAAIDDLIEKLKEQQ